MCLYISVTYADLLINAVVDLSPQWCIILIYCVFMVIWAAGRFVVCPPRDRSIGGFRIVVDVLVGALTRVFPAAPGFAVWQTTKFNADAAALNGSRSSESGLSL